MENLTEKSKDTEPTNMDNDKDIERPPVTKTEVRLPCVQDQGKLAFMLYNVYTPQECEDLIDLTEEKGYIAALLNTGGGPTGEEYYPEVRSSDRCIIDSEEMAGKLWSRVQPYIPHTFKGRTVVGLNERLRFLRYDAGGFFKRHQDGSYMRSNGDRSYITVQLYLNEGFEGGATTFMKSYNTDEGEPVIIKTGSVLVFQHDILHEGSTLISGRKYTVRTDVMYR